jgi:hypothetical protein
MRLRDTIENSIQKSTENDQSLLLVTIAEVDETTEVCTAYVLKNGQQRVFYSVPYPQNSGIKPNILAVMGFISGSKNLPFIIGCYSESVLYAVPQDEKIPLNNPLFVGVF